MRSGRERGVLELRNSPPGGGNQNRHVRHLECAAEAVDGSSDLIEQVLPHLRLPRHVITVGEKLVEPLVPGVPAAPREPLIW